MESPKGKIIIRENPLLDNSTPASDLSEKESHLEVVSVMMVDVTPKENQTQQSISIISLSVQQLQDIITNSIRAQYGGPPQTSFTCCKRINDL
ncbi:retrotransposon gag protein [Cucumis melo var. makuwa]|uniref:Retrotransposon gag protein n=1 Tax=Cucumis melo var. makuwa TaxID=1194695 RepID=A0A5A7UL59_CUCMM|nr:retrotransposon gag protein [Cucumis melo var. makuwa]